MKQTRAASATVGRRSLLSTPPHSNPVADIYYLYSRFLEVGGWDILNTWLEVARDDNNEPLLGEILEVYQSLPVTVGLLKQNSAAKTIKQLSKAEKESKCCLI